MNRNPYSAYRETSIASADPITLTTLLFEGALKAIRKARLHLDSGNRKAFGDETNRAFLILGELNVSLDMSQGEIPRQLNSLYAYCMRRLVEAAVDGHTALDEVESLLQPVVDSWKTATANLRAAPGANAA